MEVVARQADFIKCGHRVTGADFAGVYLVVIEIIFVEFVNILLAINRVDKEIAV